MDWRKALLVAPIAAVLIGTVAGITVVERDLRVAAMPPTPDAALHAQAAGGLGMVLPPAADPDELALQAIAAGRGQSQAPLVESLVRDPNALLDVMRMVRQDPTLRAEALDRVRRSGLGGGLAGGMTDEVLTRALDSLLSNPDRLRGVLGQIGGSPELLQGMLGQMGMPDVSSDQIQFLLRRLGQEPDLLARLAAGDAGAVEGLSDELAGLMAGGELDVQSLLNSLGQGQPLPPTGTTDPLLGLGALGAAGTGALSEPLLGTEMLGTGASLSLLSDMLAGFGGADTAQLQNALRAGDISGILSLFRSLYGPTGSLSGNPDLGGGVIGSYTDLLDALMGLE